MGWDPELWDSAHQGSSGVEPGDESPRKGLPTSSVRVHRWRLQCSTMCCEHFGELGLEPGSAVLRIDFWTLICLS